MSNKTQLCMLVEEEQRSIRFVGWGHYDYIHQHGIRHMTVQVIPVVCSEGKPMLITHVRPPRPSPTAVELGKKDFCGGHIHFQDSDKYREWDDPGFLKDVSLDTAIEEANEEVVCCDEQDQRIKFNENHLHLLGQIGEFSVNTSGRGGRRNVEISSAYVLKIPAEHKVCEIQETSRTTGVHSCEPIPIELGELIKEFTEDKSKFADGLGRILTKVCSSNRFKRTLEDLLKQICSQ